MWTTMKKDMAVIGFSSAGSPLEPAWPSTHRALLPVAGKPLIIHLIEQLASIGIKHIRIAGSIQQYAVKARIGNGQEWGITVRYSDLHGPDLCFETLLERGECLYLLGDHMLNVVQALNLLETTAESTGRVENFDSAAYWKLEADGFHCIEIPNPDFAKGAMIKTALDFHRANKLLVTGMVTDFELPGRAIRESVQVGWDSEIHPRALLEPGVAVGNECEIGDGVFLGAGCVIGNGCVIQKHAQLSNVSVLPNTYVGSHVRLKDAVITPRAIFDLAGKYWVINDKSVISRVRSNRESVTGLPAEMLYEIERA